MSLKVEKLEKSMAKLTIEVSADDFEKAIEEAYQKQRGRIAVPGFRKGKAPRKLIESMYGKNVFFEDAANSIIPKEYEKAYDECEEDITSTPEIDVVQIEEGKAFIFTATVALKPEIELGKYTEVEVEEVPVEVTEEEIDAALSKERESNARTVSVEDRAVQDGDITTIDFEGFVDGEAFEGGKGENYPLTIGSAAFIPGFEEQLIGAELNKEKEVHVTFPEDYQAANLAGKEAVFKCTVKEIKVKDYPELDDEFAAEVSEFDTLEEYKADIKKKLEEKKQKEADEAKEDATLDKVIEDSKIEIPAPMLLTEQKQMFDQFAQRISMQGMPVDQYLQYTGQTRETMIEQIKPQAEKKIKSRLVLEAVATAEGLTASDEDFDKEVETMAESYKMEVDKVKELLGENEQKQIRDDLAAKKALTFITEHAKVTKVSKKSAKKTTKAAAKTNEKATEEEKDAE